MAAVLTGVWGAGAIADPPALAIICLSGRVGQVEMKMRPFTAAGEYDLLAFLCNHGGKVVAALGPVTGAGQGSRFVVKGENIEQVLTPAFSVAIWPTVEPSRCMWSRLMLVMIDSTGCETFVASSRPPRPVSSTARSTRARAK